MAILSLCLTSSLSLFLSLHPALSLYLLLPPLISSQIPSTALAPIAAKAGPGF